jgi:RND family efflux transporter MFP subunit
MKSSRSTALVSSALLLAAVSLGGLRSRLCAASDEGSGDNRPIVNVVVAKKSSEATPLSLPATLQAFQDTPIFARTTGYLAKWLVDIGDKVEAGQTMAEIDVPDLDQELNQAKANLEVAKANQELARISSDRWKDLGKQNAVAQQDVDQKVADYAAKNSDVAAAQANVDRLLQLTAFRHVTAPYAGVVTARNAEVGAYIAPGAGTELFHIAQVDTLRVFVSVPQSYVRAIKPGLPAELTVAEYPGRIFQGKIARLSGALDAGSRTLLTEVAIPNPKGELFAGMFGQVRFRLTPAAPAIMIPANAAIVRAAGTLVAVVTKDGKIKIQKVRFGRDFGTKIEILDGLEEGTRIVANPSDALTDGMAVEVASPQAAQ